MTSSAPAGYFSSIDVRYYFDKKELCLGFPYIDQAAAYQALNHEARILPNEPENVYLPVSSKMQYIRDSMIGLVVGFASKTDAKEWCLRSVLGDMYSSKEVHFPLTWEGGSLDKKLRISPSLESEPELEPEPELDGYRSDPTEQQQSRPRGPKWVNTSKPPSSGPRRKAMPSFNRDRPPPSAATHRRFGPRNNATGSGHYL